MIIILYAYCHVLYNLLMFNLIAHDITLVKLNSIGIRITVVTMQKILILRYSIVTTEEYTF